MGEGWRREGLTIGLVPTMGALHAGHRSLLERARAENDRVVASIFVNPLQFGPGEDFDRYPRTLGSDLALLAEVGADAAYVPAVSDMYPASASTRVAVGGLTEALEGAHRPGHFDGVATVVLKLFEAVRPHRAYFGRKDAQQLAVVSRMAADLDTGVEIVPCPIVREPDGLALSSRNRYLSAEERRGALSLSRALAAAAARWQAGEHRPERLRSVLAGVLESEPLARVDYAEVVDPATFAGPGSLAVLAVRVGATRLIDNHDLAEPFPVAY